MKLGNSSTAGEGIARYPKQVPVPEGKPVECSSWFLLLIPNKDPNTRWGLHSSSLEKKSSTRGLCTMNNN